MAVAPTIRSYLERRTNIIYKQVLNERQFKFQGWGKFSDFGNKKKEEC